MKNKTLCLALIGCLLCLSVFGGHSARAHAESTYAGLYDAYPPFIANTAPPLVMLVMGRNHKLFYEAYNDASDLNGDGVLDTTYKPDQIDYYGYFDSYKYYQYSQSDQLFVPAGTTANKKAPAGAYWSGDFLNYLTMSRMDTIRKVLYGGYRSVDTETETVLERAYIPQDAHSWGKEYESAQRDGYDIRDYTPLDLPAPAKRHLFASTSLTDPTNANYRPLLRVAPDNDFRIWQWVAKERPVCDDSIIRQWRIVPADAVSGISNVTQTVYKAGHGTAMGGRLGSPGDHAAYNTYVQKYGNAANFQGSQTVDTIDGSGNPFGVNNHFMTIFNGTLNIPTSGSYEFAVDGDDAVEFLIDINGDGDFEDSGEVVAAWYGGHGECDCQDHKGSVFLNAGSYSFQFRHQDSTGRDSYHLYWHSPMPGGITDYAVRVQVAMAAMPESNCKRYPAGNYKPTGLLQRHGETDSMYFGLITGSYTHNTKGGVLRKNIASITDEIDTANGRFISDKGIVRTLDRIRISGFKYSDYSYFGGWVFDRPMNAGEFPDWGNPLGEMMFEALRYFGGEASPSSDFHSATMAIDDALKLPNEGWLDPYDYAASGFAYCAKPFIIAISDIYPTYDSDDLPGSAFGGPAARQVGNSDDLLNVADIADRIYAAEGLSGDNFIGQQASSYDGACTAKAVNGLGDIRGLCPEEPTKQGSYYSASVAHFGNTRDLSVAESDQKVTSYFVGLASPLPNIELQVQAKIIRLVPFAKTVGNRWGGLDSSQGAFQPTGTIVDFFVEQIKPHYGRFRINFENAEQGADHDMDAIVIYEYQLVDAKGKPVTETTIDQAVSVDISLTSEYASALNFMHLGYIISGTTQDGTYLEVRSKDVPESVDVDYFLDTPDGVWADTGGNAWDDGKALPLTHTRRFSSGSAGASPASLLPNPLWYAAKWGGFKDLNGNEEPDLQEEWDKDGDGVPDTYFYVVNPLKLEQQLSRSFAEILAKTSSGTSAAVVANSNDGEGATVQAFFEPYYVHPGTSEAVSWMGHLNSFWVDQFGHLREDSNTNGRLDMDADRIIEFGNGINGTPFIKRYTQHYHYDNDNQQDEACVVANCTTAFDTINMDDIEPIFSAGEQLYRRSADDRTIFTFIDGNGGDNDGDGLVDESGEKEGAKTVGVVSDPQGDAFNDNSGEIISFHVDNAARIAPFLGIQNSVFTYLNDKSNPGPDTRAINLIDYIRGKDSADLAGKPGTRNRTFEGHVWKLGDIVHSTPVSVGAPMDNYDLIYSDQSYLGYVRQYADREAVVYVGANDGMLHAFSQGEYYTKYTRTQTAIEKESGYRPVDSTPLGDELWAYVPQSLLPHLKWLADPNYGHTFYVDQKPKVFDARIFDDDAIHPGGWGTLLLVGLGRGGKHISVDADFGSGDVTRHFYPTYICMDITEPRRPRLLWERSYQNLGMSTSIPAIIQVGAAYNASSDTWEKGKWLAVFGSGPHDELGKSDFNGRSDQNGHIYVVDILTGDPYGSAGNEWLFDTGLANAVMNSPSSLDKGTDAGIGPVPGLTYNVDAVYFGSAYRDGSDWKGKIFKVNTRYSGEEPSDDPDRWSLSTLYDSQRPITAPVSLSVDRLDNVWVFFGTGRYMEMADRQTAEQQYIIGLKDPYFSKLYEQSDSNYNGKGDYYLNNASNAPTLTLDDLFYANPYRSYATTKAIEPQPGGKAAITTWQTLLDTVRYEFDGWYRELDPQQPIGSASQRVISKPAILGGMVFVPVYIPDTDICGFGGSSDLYGLFYETGTPAWQHVFAGYEAIDSMVVDGQSQQHERVKYRSGTVLNSGPPPATISVHIGREKGLKILTQTGTGAVLEAQINPAMALESNIEFWHENEGQ